MLDQSYNAGIKEIKENMLKFLEKKREEFKDFRLSVPAPSEVDCIFYGAKLLDYLSSMAPANAFNFKKKEDVTEIAHYLQNVACEWRGEPFPFLRIEFGNMVLDKNVKEYCKEKDIEPLYFFDWVLMEFFLKSTTMPGQ